MNSKFDLIWAKLEFLMDPQPHQKKPIKLHGTGFPGWTKRVMTHRGRIWGRKKEPLYVFLCLTQTGVLFGPNRKSLCKLHQMSHIPLWNRGRVHSQLVKQPISHLHWNSKLQLTQKTSASYGLCYLILKACKIAKSVFPNWHIPKQCDRQRFKSFLATKYLQKIFFILLKLQ